MKIFMTAALISALSIVLAAPPRFSYATNATVTVQGTQSGQGVQSGQGATSEQGQKPPSEYLSNLYLWFMGFVGIAALFAIVTGGVMYMFSGANLTTVENAKKWITNAIWGIVLAAASYLILNTINPDLVAGFDLKTVIQRAMPQSAP